MTIHQQRTPDFVCEVCGNNFPSHYNGFHHGLASANFHRHIEVCALKREVRQIHTSAFRWTTIAIGLIIVGMCVIAGIAFSRYLCPFPW